MSDVWVVFCTCPDTPSADALAMRLLENDAAACVNIMPACSSVYRWKGAVERATEVQLLIKTTEACYRAVETLIRAHHPYEVPEVLAIKAAAGLPAYLDWIRHETRQTRSQVIHPTGGKPGLDLESTQR